MKKVILDTNVFDMILAGTLDANLIANCIVVATHVQRDELLAIRDVAYQEKLLRVFAIVTSEIVETTVAVWDASNWDESKFGTDKQNALFLKLRDQLTKLDKKAKKQLLNQTRDILIAVTAIEEKYELITTDLKLSEVVKSNGGLVTWIKKII